MYAEVASIFIPHVESVWHEPVESSHHHDLLEQIKSALSSACKARPANLVISMVEFDDLETEVVLPA